ncbi:MAG TPA: putative metal-binding motif-containing protein, partial [Sandaracinaceae bacterium]
MHGRILIALAMLASACGSEPPAHDAGLDAGIDGSGEADGGARRCERARDCDDGLFCNGVETCIDTFCMPGEPPCDSDTETCDETADRCEAIDCAGEAADRDGDGYRSIACGGDDCDDDAAHINPGRTEVCVPDDPTDEDCNPRTFGFDDIDGDGAADERCFNVASDGTRHGGTDCNDNNSVIHPLAVERCDGVVDEDCDGSVDEDCLCSPEGSTRPCGTGLGECAGAFETCTAAGWSPCSATPGGELCDGSRDEDCDGTIDEGCSCVTGTTRSCGTGACAGTQRCVAGAWDACDGPSPSPELCNGVDDDCNGSVDDVPGLGSSCGSSTGTCRPGTLMCGASPMPVCGGAGYVGPTTEACNHLDEDCDGQIDDGVHAAACTRTFPPRGGGLLNPPQYYCLPSGTMCDGHLASGASGGQPVAAAFTTWRGDLGRASLFRARVSLRDTSSDGTTPDGWVTFWLTTSRALGSDAAGPGDFGIGHGIPLAPGSTDRGLIVTLCAQSTGTFAYAWTGSSWRELGATLPAASCLVIPTSTTEY